jgi:hypothetical protein
MFFMTLEHTVENMAIAIKAMTGRSPDATSLRADYLSVLNANQEVSLSRSERPMVNFEDSIIAQSSQFENMQRSEGGTRLGNLNDDARYRVSRNITHSLQLLDVLLPLPSQLLKLQVFDIVCSRVSDSGGGTASNLLGLIWLSPHPAWTSIDYAECLLHESVHLTLFLGDMTRGLYVNPREVRLNPEARAVSAIRGEKRPLDKTLHAAGVAAVLSEYYRALGATATSDAFIEPLRDSVRDMELASRFLSPYGREVLQAVAEFAEERSATLVGI